MVWGQGLVCKGSGCRGLVRSSVKRITAFLSAVKFSQLLGEKGPRRLRFATDGGLMVIEEFNFAQFREPFPVLKSYKSEKFSSKNSPQFAETYSASFAEYFAL